MHRLIAPLLIIAAVAACAPQISSEYAATGPVDKAFRSGGTVNMDLSAGQYVITGVNENRIRVRWSARNPEDAKKAKVVVDVKESHARILTDGPSNNFRVEIDLPARSDLVLRLSAGELSLRGLEGNKDISAWAGEVKVGVRDAAEYGKVSASLTAGEIRADAFGEKREGVFPGFTWSGKGRYELSTRLTAGQITFSEETAAPAADEAEEQAPEPKAPGGA
jgi:hypothetical protein